MRTLTWLGLCLILVACTEKAPPTPPIPSPAPPTVTPDTPDPTAIPPSAAPCPTTTTPQLARPGPYRVGTRVMTIMDPNREKHEVAMTLWYPAVTEADSAASDRTQAPYPVVIYSFAKYYDGQSHGKVQGVLARHVASHGFVVIGVEHQDKSNTEVLVDRPLDILAVINYLDSISQVNTREAFNDLLSGRSERFLPDDLTGMLQMAKLGVVGQWSATALQMGGARFDPAFYASWYLAHPETAQASIPPEALVSNFSLVSEVGNTDENGLCYIPTDPRIRAVVVLGPDLTPVFGERGLATVTVPLLVMATAGEGKVNYEDEVVALLDQNVGSAEHYLISFGSSDELFCFCSTSRNLLITAFLGYYLDGKAEYAPYLTESYVNNLAGMVWGPYSRP